MPSLSRLLATAADLTGPQCENREYAGALTELIASFMPGDPDAARAYIWDHLMAGPNPYAANDSAAGALLPHSAYGIWVDPHGYFWIDTQDDTTHPYRVTQAGEADQFHTLAEALSANLTALNPTPERPAPSATPS